FNGSHWVIGRVMTVDTRHHPDQGQRLKKWWLNIALERARAGHGGLHSYNLFTVSEADYQRLEELHRAYFREMRSIVAQSSPAERVVLGAVHLLSSGAQGTGDLGDEPKATLP